MIDHFITVADPLGRLVQLPETLGRDEAWQTAGSGISDEFRKVVEAPACMIEVAPGQLYYFRLIRWNYTMLVEVFLQGHTWVAMRCEKNPSSELVQVLLAKGKFIAGSSLD